MTEKTAVRPWTAEEDELLLKAVTGKASDNWKDIAAFVPGRTNKACRKVSSSSCAMISQMQMYHFAAVVTFVVSFNQENRLDKGGG